MRRDGPQRLSLRDLARRLGVSYGAPHHHFPEKQDLLAAIAEEGFMELLADVRQRLLDAGNVDPVERLRIAAATYLDFATGERAHYQVMFLPLLRDRVRFAALHRTGGYALELLAEPSRPRAYRGTGRGFARSPGGPPCTALPSSRATASSTGPPWATSPRSGA